MDCMYCEENRDLLHLMEPIIELEYSRIYLFKNQRYYGRCVVAFKIRHCRELFELSENERNGYMREVARTAEAIQKITNADKINYAIYGDKVSHVHMHIVPKYIGGPEWGDPFSMAAESILLQEKEKEKLKGAIRAYLIQMAIEEG